MSAAPVLRLDAARARSLTRDLQKALDVAVELVRELWQGEAWRSLGYDSWETYCAEELPQLRVIVRGMPKEEQTAKIEVLRRDGMSLRDLAELTGLSPNTVRQRARGVELEVVRSRDGALRPAQASRAARAEPSRDAGAKPLTLRLVSLLRESGPLTVLEVCDRSRVRQSRVAPALHRLERSGRLVYLRPEKRGQTGRYDVRR